MWTFNVHFFGVNEWPVGRVGDVDRLDELFRERGHLTTKLPIWFQKLAQGKAKSLVAIAAIQPDVHKSHSDMDDSLKLRLRERGSASQRYELTLDWSKLNLVSMASKRLESFEQRAAPTLFSEKNRHISPKHTEA